MLFLWFTISLFLLFFFCLFVFVSSPQSYVAWICKAEDLVLAEERTTEEERTKIMEVSPEPDRKSSLLLFSKCRTEIFALEAFSGIKKKNYLPARGKFLQTY